MEKFIKGRWFPLTIASIIILTIASVLFFFGFRITYVPKLENSWDAISAVAAWGGVIVSVASTTASFLAVWFAIRVPQKIAEHQNKIALFTMRHEVFEIYNSCKTFSEMLRWAINRENVQLFFLDVFCNAPLDEKNIDTVYVKKESVILFDKLRKSEFLFNPSVSSYINEIAICLYQLIAASLYETETSKISEKIYKFIELMNTSQYQSVLDEMGNDLKLK